MKHCCGDVCMHGDCAQRCPDDMCHGKCMGFEYDDYDSDELGLDPEEEYDA